MEVEKIKSAERLIPDSEFYGKRLSSLLSTELTPKNIDNYADSALGGLITLIEEVLDNYSQDMPTADLNLAELEDKAFAYYDLPNISDTLDYLAIVRNSLRDIDVVIEKASSINSVIIPTDKTKTITKSTGEGVFERPTRESRVKTVLFMLQQDYEIDVKNSESLTIISGTLNGDMIRKSSYYLIAVPGLQRSMLVCDEDGNASYVFDQDRMNQYGIDNDDLMAKMKPELNSLIEDHEGLGKRIVFNKNFMDRIRDSIDNDLVSKDDSDYDQGIDLSKRNQYLKPKKAESAPSDYISVNVAIRQLRTHRSTLYEAIKECQSDPNMDFGKVGFYQFNTRYSDGLSPYQLDLIESKLSLFELAPSAPPGCLSVCEVAIMLGVKRSTLDKAIKECRSDPDMDFGALNLNKFRTRYAPSLLPYQIDLVKTKLILADLAPDGYLSGNGIAEMLSVSRSMVFRAIEECKNDNSINFGEVMKCRFNTRSIDGFSPRQIGLVEARIALYDPVSTGCLSVNGIADKFGVNYHTVARAIKDCKMEIGDANLLYFNGKKLKAYSPSQQDVIIEYLRKSKKIKPRD